MPLITRSLFVAALVVANAAQSQTPQSAPAQPAAAQPAPAPPPTVVAGIPVNYDEAKVGTYTLPDPLATSSGARVKDAATWTRVRRPEIYKLIEFTQFGRAAAKPPRV